MTFRELQEKYTELQDKYNALNKEVQKLKRLLKKSASSNQQEIQKKIDQIEAEQEEIIEKQDELLANPDKLQPQIVIFQRPETSRLLSKEKQRKLLKRIYELLNINQGAEELLKFFLFSRTTQV